MTEISEWQQYQQRGFVHLKGLLGPELIEPLRRQVKAVYEQWLHEVEVQASPAGVVNMHSLTQPRYFADSQARRAFFEALLPNVLTQRLESIFGDDLYFHNSQLFFNPRDPLFRPYWHRDLQYSPIPDDEQRRALTRMLSLHVRIVLKDEQGLVLVPGSHARWDTTRESQVRFATDGHQSHDRLPGETLMPLQVGDVLVFNAQMLHRGEYALNCERQALDLCVGRPDPLIIGSLDVDNLPKEQEFTGMSNPDFYRRAFKAMG